MYEKRRLQLYLELLILIQRDFIFRFFIVNVSVRIGWP